MRRPVLTTAAATAVLALALPSSAEDPAEPVPTPPCEAVEGATTIGAEPVEPIAFNAPLVPNMPFHDAAATGGLPVESPPESMATFDFVVDASGGTVVDAVRAPVTFTVDWPEDSGDFDVYLLDAAGNELGSGTSFNPLDGAGEVVGPVTRMHCSVVTLRVENYLGVPDLPMTIEVTRGAPRR